VLIPLALGVALLGLFGLVEGKLAADPLIPLDVFKMPTLRAANLIVALLFGAMFGAMFGMWYFVSLYLQEVKGQDALIAGISFLPMTLLVFAGSATAPKLVARFGVRTTLGIGLSLATLGFLILATVDASSGIETAILPGGMLTALGTGWSLVPATIVAVKGVAPEQNGLASGVVNTSRLVGGTLGLAVLTTIATSHTNNLIGSGTAPLDALTSGYKIAFLIAAGLSFAALTAALTLLRGRPEGVVRPASQGA
jgi:predicted MFS family arabinose efflux permease